MGLPFVAASGQLFPLQSLVVTPGDGAALVVVGEPIEDTIDDPVGTAVAAAIDVTEVAELGTAEAVAVVEIELAIDNSVAAIGVIVAKTVDEGVRGSLLNGGTYRRRRHRRRGRLSVSGQ